MSLQAASGCALRCPYPRSRANRPESGFSACAQIARASDVRCFCPPESVMPRSPTIVLEAVREALNFAGNAGDFGGLEDVPHPATFVHAEGDVFAHRFAEQKSVLRHVADRAAQFRQRIVANRAPIDEAAFPAGASHNRAISAASVDLPLPVGPTIARVEPAGTCRIISCSTGSFGAPVRGRRVREIQMCEIQFRREFGCLAALDCISVARTYCRIAVRASALPR